MDSEHGRVMHIWWTEELATGHPVIDGQHRAIFEKADGFLQSMLQGHGRDELEPMFTFLDDYVKEHFTAEESLMLGSEYQGYGPHKQAHIDFMVRLSELRADFLDEGASSYLAINLQRLVGELLRNHIKSADRAVAEHIRSRG